MKDVMAMAGRNNSGWSGLTRTRVTAVVAIALISLVSAGMVAAAEPPASGPAASAPATAPVVAIVKGTDVPKMVAEALDLLGGVKQFVKDGQKVVLKPNLVGQPSLDGHGNLVGSKQVRAGLCTDVRVVEALSRQLQATAACKIAVAEGTPNDLPSLFEFLGYNKLAKDVGLELVDTATAPRMAVKIDGLGRKQYDMPVVTQTADVLIDMPVMKTHQLCVVTLGMKNLFGLLPNRKNPFHDKIDGVLCDLARMRRPDLVIVDALVATEGQGPLEGTPVRMDLIVAGRDVVAVDAVCTAIMGFDPRRVKHLVTAHHSGLGEIDLAKITVKGAPIASVRRQFRPASWWASIEIDRTDQRIAKLQKLADHVWKDHDGQWGGMHFDAKRLKVDNVKYPTRKSEGFRISSESHPLKPGKLVFEVPFTAMYPEDGQAAVDELAEWIAQNLGQDVKMVKHAWAPPE